MNAVTGRLAFKTQAGGSARTEPAILSSGSYRDLLPSLRGWGRRLAADPRPSCTGRFGCEWSRRWSYRPHGRARV